MIPEIIISMSIIVVTYFINSKVQRTIQSIGEKQNLEPQIIEIIQLFSKVFIYGVGITLCLENLHVQLLTLFGTLGVVGIGAGLALQSTVSSMVAGIFILYYKPYFIGDYVQFSTKDYKEPIQGEIKNIDLRRTTLEHQGNMISIPNDTLYNAILTIKKKR